MRIAVLAGGASLEREVSLRSGHRVAAALISRGHDTTVLDPAEVPLAEAVAGGGFDVCYIALHGKAGEDGAVQRLLELLGVPYTGTGPFACQLAFDKALAKEALDASGVSTPPWVTLQSAALRDLGAGAALDLIVERLGLPLVVKPSRAGSAMGIKFVERVGELPAAVMGALLGAPAEVLPLVEIAPRSGVYDYAARYTAGATEYFAPARVSDDVTAACREESLRAFQVLGLRDVARADLIVDADGHPWVLEVNVCPGMTDTSLLPMAAQAAGSGFDDLCQRVLELAVSRAAPVG